MPNPQLPDTYTLPLPNGQQYPLRRVGAGTFIMGSEGKDAYDDEKPEHLVRLSRDYYIGIYPVTQAVWKAVMDGHNPARFQGDQRPVEQVSWVDIVSGGQDASVPEAFLSRLNAWFKKIDKPGGLEKAHFRLPTEAEWEYAAKGGHKSALSEAEIANPPKAEERYPLYAGSDKLKEVGWYYLNSHGETKEVGLKHANELGLYDMSGNVFEWCSDWFSNGYYTDCARQGIVEDPRGPEKGSARVPRGGRWGFGPRGCRAAFRYGWGDPSTRSVYMGFRLLFVP